MFKYKSPCAIVLFIIMLQPEAKTQKVAYADVQLGHEIKIAGKTGNNIHVWSSSISQPLSFIKKATLTLHVLSADMRLQTEKKIELGEVISWDIDFQFEDSCYYANIIFFAAFNDKLLLKIDPDGNITDLTEKPALWSVEKTPFGKYINQRLYHCSKRQHRFCRKN